MVSGDVWGEPTTSTRGIRWGGLKGWPTARREGCWRAGEREEHVRPEVLVRIGMCGGRRASIWVRRVDLMERFSGPFS